MVRLFGGAVLVIGGIGVLIELRIHRSYLHPLIRHHHIVRLDVVGWGGLGYGLARIAAWTLVLTGALLFRAGLVARARHRSPATS